MHVISEDPSLGPAAANRKSFLLLRWLLIILAGYLTMFTNINEEALVGNFLLVTAFALSNVLISLSPLPLVVALKSRHILAAIDAVFVCAFLYYLRVDQASLHLPFMGVVVLAILWPDLRVVLFALFVVSLLFGLLTNFQLFGAGINVQLDEFLALALLFVVSIFYIFMVDRFDRDSEISEALIQEKRNAENISDITRKLSTSLEAKEILTMLVERFAEMIPAAKCSIVRMSPAEDAVIVASSDPDMAPRVSLDDAPALREALEGKKRTSAPLKPGTDTLAVPMVSRDEVIASVYFEKIVDQDSPWEGSLSLIEIVVSTAANALANAERFDELKLLANTDSMTKLANYDFFKTQLSYEIDRAKRHDRTVSLLMVDLDWLKNINDELGHPVGDRVIRSVADAIRSNCRDIDVGARCGGEEFAVILPETDLDDGMKAAERLRQHIEKIERFDTKITVSIGVANFPANAETGEDLVAAADEALYAAKRGGRNQVAALN